MAGKVKTTILVFSLCVAAFTGGTYFFKVLYPQKITHKQDDVAIQVEVEPRSWKQQKIDSIVNTRKSFINQHLDINSLLKLSEKKQSHLSINNTTKDFQKIDADLLFLTPAKTIQLINISKNDTDQEKIIKIHNFVKDHSIKTYPLFDYYENYLSDDLDPDQFFAVYGSGLCSNFAIVFNSIAKKYGFKSRVWSFNGHVAAEVFYDGEWHFFDPDTLGYFEDEDSRVVSLREVKKLASENKLEKYNSIIASEEDNEIMLIDDLPQKNKQGLGELEFFPGEERVFLSGLYMISTNGRYLIDEGYPLKHEPRSLLDEHNRSMANFMRVIPLDDFKNNNQLEISSFFPISGVFISLPRSFQDNDVIPEVKFQSELIESDSWMNGETIINPELNQTYLNFSFALRHLENSPSHEFKLRNIEKLLKNYPNAKLLVVGAYSHRNTNFNSGDLVDIDNEVFEINLLSNYLMNFPMMKLRELFLLLKFV